MFGVNFPVKTDHLDPIGAVRAVRAVRVGGCAHGSLWRHSLRDLRPALRSLGPAGAESLGGLRSGGISWGIDIAYSV